MNTSDLTSSIAYCGLICKLCFLADKCNGCKSKCNICDNNLSIERCPQKECSIENGFLGCWECSDLEYCTKGVYSSENSPKVKAFALFIQMYGSPKFIESVMSNIEKGISVKKGEDYDSLDIDAIHKLLLSGSALS